MQYNEFKYDINVYTSLQIAAKFNIIIIKRAPLICTEKNQYNLIKLIEIAYAQQSAEQIHIKCFCAKHI